MSSFRVVGGRFPDSPTVQTSGRTNGLRVPLTAVAWMSAPSAPNPRFRRSRRRPSGGKGSSSSWDAGRVLALSGGDAASVSCGIAATREHDMTEQRSFKRLVRARMDKTGESYTAARATILKGADEPDPGEKRLLIVPDASIRERTGRGWEEWFDILDEWGAADVRIATSRNGSPAS